MEIPTNNNLLIAACVLTLKYFLLINFYNEYDRKILKLLTVALNKHKKYCINVLEVIKA